MFDYPWGGGGVGGGWPVALMGGVPPSPSPLYFFGPLGLIAERVSDG